jgi:hypothetical protein
MTDLSDPTGTITSADPDVDGPGDPDAIPAVPVFDGPVPTDQGDAEDPTHSDHSISSATSGFDADQAAHARRVGANYCQHLLMAINQVTYTEDLHDRWTPFTHNQFLSTLLPFSGDCSSTATFILFRALRTVAPHMEDIVNGELWKGGNTASIARHGKVVEHDSNIKVLDLILYGSAPSFEHVAVAIGGGFVFSHGSMPGPFKLGLDYRHDRGPTHRFI